VRVQGLRIFVSRSSNEELMKEKKVRAKRSRLISESSTKGTTRFTVLVIRVSYEP
jgi:hypothetical protein